MSEFIKSWTENSAKLTAAHSYHPSQEHDACGVGLVASIDGKPRREVVQAGIDALKAVWHRGAVDADGKTGDGAGIHVQIPQDFLKEHIRRTGHEPLEACCVAEQSGARRRQLHHRLPNCHDVRHSTSSIGPGM